jgi:hypothetical protein
VRALPPPTLPGTRRIGQLSGSGNTFPDPNFPNEPFLARYFPSRSIVNFHDFDLLSIAAIFQQVHQ